MPLPETERGSIEKRLATVDIRQLISISSSYGMRKSVNLEL